MFNPHKGTIALKAIYKIIIPTVGCLPFKSGLGDLFFPPYTPVKD